MYHQSVEVLVSHALWLEVACEGFDDHTSGDNRLVEKWRRGISDIDEHESVHAHSMSHIFPVESLELVSIDGNVVNDSLVFLGSRLVAPNAGPLNLQFP